jgi:putative ABC transport system permease protein
MKFFDYIRFGLKNILRQKARTILTIIAIVIGATSVVLMLTIIFGAKQAAINQIESAGALTQVTVSGYADLSADDVFNSNGHGGTDTTKLTDELLTKVKAIPHVSSGYAVLSPWQLQSAAVTDEAGNKLKFDRVQMAAYVPSKDNESVVSAGRNLQPDDVYSMLIGAQILNVMGLKGKPEEAIGKTLTFGVPGYVGDNVDVPLPPPPSDKPGNNSAQDDYWQNLQKHTSPIKVTVVGVMATGLFDQQTFVPMALARKMMVQNTWQQEQTQPDPQQNQNCGRNGCPQPTPKYTLTKNDQFDQQGYSNFILKADSLDNVDAVAKSVKDMKLGAATAKSVIDQILQVFKMVSILFGAIGGISLIVAAIGVVNTMVMATLERTREIGVMRACGATRAAVRRLFTFEAALLGFWGGVFGTGVGYGLFWGVKYFAGSQLSSNNVPLSVLSIPIWLALTTVAATTLIGMLAGYGPAVRAARMNPVDALRYE